MENTVTISINEYDKLREIKKKIDKNKVVIKLDATTHYYGEIYSTESQYLSTDELFHKLKTEIDIVSKSLAEASIKNIEKEDEIKEQKNKAFVAEKLLQSINGTWWFKFFAKKEHKGIDVFKL